MKNLSSFYPRAFCILTSLVCGFYSFGQFSSVGDDFEGAGTISSWTGDGCDIDTQFANPFVDAINPSSTVMKYEDDGGSYANARFTNPQNFNMTTGGLFTFKLYVPSNGITGNSPNQISVKLQNGYMPSSWMTQSEIIKPVVLDQWQTVSIDFGSGEHVNFDQTSPEPMDRVDFNRVLFQLNGENNNDHVTAYLDDLTYDGLLGYDPDITTSEYDVLVWSDDFDGSGAIDPVKWHHQTQLPNSWGWHNAELQHYTDRVDNSYVQDGHMHIVAKREPFFDQGLNRQYTSARLNSKFAFTYGRVEVRAKIPEGEGTWPAIWTLGKNVSEAGGYWASTFGNTGWPACGEIDIMEHWGTNQHFTQSALHTPSSFGGTINHGGLYSADVSNEFHVYGMEWTEEEIRFTVDGQVHYIYHPANQTNSTWPYYQDQYLLLNVAIQESISPTFEESEMVLDYVRVYQDDANSVEEFADASEMGLYPNPAQDSFVLKMDGEWSNAEVMVFDAIGNKVLSEPLVASSTLIDIRALAPGFYSVQVVNGSSILRKTFIKE